MTACPAEPRKRMGEFDRIERFFAKPAAALRLRLGQDAALLGIGDDCALVSQRSAAAIATGNSRSRGTWQSLAISSDMLVCGRHFASDVDPESLGHKALAVNLSDLAAMGAEPLAFTLSLAIDTPQDDAWLADFSRGLFSLADSHRCELIGGDTTAGPLCVSLTVIGQLDAALALRRDAAQPGDQVWVSGELGAAAFALKYPGVSTEARERLDWPEPRVELGMALRGLSACAIDLSDGLLGDIVHVLERSRVGIVLYAERIPTHEALRACEPNERLELALQGGDDYELLFTAAPAMGPAIERLSRNCGLRLSCIGEITADHRRDILDARGVALDLAFRGFDHFK